MLLILLNVVGPVFLVSFVGYLWGVTKRPFDAGVFSVIASSVGTPCLVIDALSTAGLKLDQFAVMGGGSVLCVAFSLALGWLTVKLTRQPVATYLPSLVFANTGNMGLPLASFAFGADGLGLAMAYFAVNTVFNFTIGQGLAARKLTLLEVVRSPLVWSTLLGAGLSVTNTALPLVIARALHILGGLTIPMMLLALGVSLSKLKVTSMNRALLFSVVRLAGGFGIGWLVAWMMGLEGLSRGALVLQSAMPAAVYNYMFAARYNNQPEEVAGVVVVSTLMSIIALPVFLWTVM